MPSYTLIGDFTGFTFPTSYIYYYNVFQQTGSDSSGYSTGTETMEAIGDYFVGLYGGTYTVTNIGNVYTLSLTLTTDPSGDDAGDLSVVSIGDTDLKGYFFAIQYGAQQTTPCPTCMALTIENCAPVEISLPVEDGDYDVTLYDNQSGVSYTQSLSFVDGSAIWNTTNTAGVFTPFSIYTLTVTDSSGTPVSWPVGPNEYTCARVTFSATVDTNVDG